VDLISSSCAYCGVGCGLVFNSKTLKPSKNHPSNLGLACKKGLLQHKVNKNRLLKPLFRESIDEEFKEISYKEAIEKVAAKLKVTEPKKMGFYLSGQLLNEDYYIANKLAKGFLGCSNVDTNSRTCMSSAVVAYKKVLGSDYVPITMEDVLGSDLFVIAGGNIASNHIVFFNRIKKAKKMGLKLIVIDPRETKTAKLADLYIPIAPGGDTYFFLAVAKSFYDENLIDFDFLKSSCNFDEAFFDKLKKIDIGENLKKAGVAKDNLDSFINFWKESQDITGGWTMGLNQSSEGVEKNISFINLFTLTGKIFKPKNGPLSLTGQPNAMGGREVGGLATTLAVHLDYSEENIKKVADFWKSDNISKREGLTADEMIKKGGLKFLLVAHTDPVYHLPNRFESEKKFEKIDFVVELNAFSGSETSKFAHLILPVAPFGEKTGTQTNLDRVITLIKSFKEKKVKQDYEVLCDIAKELGFDGFDFNSSTEIFDEYKEMTRLSDMNIYQTSYKELEVSPFRWGRNLTKALTKNSKINLIWSEPKNRSLKTDSKYPYILLTSRVENHWHSMTKTAQVIDDDIEYVEISKKNMQKLSLKEGDFVLVKSEFGEAKLKVCEALIRDDAINIPMHFRGINYLTNGILDPQSKEPDYNHTPVSIEKYS